jgi:hypothetical protein
MVKMVDLFIFELFLARHELIDSVDHPGDEGHDTRHDEESKADSDKVKEAHVRGAREVVYLARTDYCWGRRVELGCCLCLLLHMGLHFVDSCLLFGFFCLLELLLLPFRDVVMYWLRGRL